MDDEEMMRLINKKMFEHYGCTGHLGDQRRGGGCPLPEEIATGERFDLVLLDLRVNGGMGGLEAARRIVALDPEAAMVAISGDSGSEVMLLVIPSTILSPLWPNLFPSMRLRIWSTVSFELPGETRV